MKVILRKRKISTTSCPKCASCGELGYSTGPRFQYDLSFTRMFVDCTQKAFCTVTCAQKYHRGKDVYIEKEMR